MMLRSQEKVTPSIDQTVSSFSAVDTRTGEDRWGSATRIAFRFSFIYLTLYIVFGGLMMFPLWLVFGRSHFGTFSIGDWGPFRGIVTWTGTHLFHVTASSVPIYEPSPMAWVQLFCILVFATVGTVIWSALDRKRRNYGALHAWFRVAVLVWLASSMLFYGIGKLIPAQMWFPRLTHLLERFRDFSPMAVLRNSIGTSPAYEIFTGCAEALGGLLLIIPGMTTLGALICLADLTNVFMLNMTYDVNVKALSFHLLLLSVFLLAPDAGRLANFFLGRPTTPARQRSLFSFTQPRPGQLVLDGTIDGHKIHARLSRFDASKFYLVSHSRRLNWVGSGSYQ